MPISTDDLLTIWEKTLPFSELPDPALVVQSVTAGFPELDHMALTYRLAWWARLHHCGASTEAEALVYRWWTTASGSPGLSPDLGLTRAHEDARTCALTGWTDKDRQSPGRASLCGRPPGQSAEARMSEGEMECLTIDKLTNLWSTLAPFSELPDLAQVCTKFVAAFPGVDHIANTWRLYLWIETTGTEVRTPARLIYTWWTTASGFPSPKRKAKSKAKAEAEASIDPIYLGK